MDPTRSSPGWYSDPTQRHEYRYHDGVGWTVHVGDWGVASTDEGMGTVQWQGSLAAGGPRTAEVGDSLSRPVDGVAAHYSQMPPKRQVPAVLVIVAVLCVLLLVLLVGGGVAAFAVFKATHHTMQVEVQARDPDYCDNVKRVEGAELEVDDDNGQTIGTGTLEFTDQAGCGTLTAKIDNVPNLPKYHIEWVGNLAPIEIRTREEVERFDWTVFIVI